MPRRLKHWGWGYEDEQPSPDDLAAAAPGVRAHLGFGAEEPEAAVPLDGMGRRCCRRVER